MKPAIELFFDHETQAVQVKVDPEQVKTWEFAKAIIAMCGEAADKQAKMTALMQMQAAQQAQQQGDRIARSLINGR